MPKTRSGFLSVVNAVVLTCRDRVGWNGVDIVLTPTGAWEWEDLKLRNLTRIKKDKEGGIAR